MMVSLDGRKTEQDQSEIKASRWLSAGQQIWGDESQVR